MSHEGCNLPPKIKIDRHVRVTLTSICCLILCLNDYGVDFLFKNIFLLDIFYLKRRSNQMTGSKNEVTNEQKLFFTDSKFF